jgi:hypothetical protein
MGSVKKMIGKFVGKEVGGVVPIKPVEQVQEEKQAAAQVVERTEAQAGAAAARRRRGGRVGQRGLLYASRLGGGGAGRGEDQNTLGSA